MSNVSLIIEERAASIGNFLVGRLLPFREKRAVGPFVFIDHMGPVAMSECENFDVPPHPHIGLSTLTYLFEGSITHRDSTGAVMDITPGAVNWMTAGKGVVHSERTPEHLRHSDKSLHGLQIWVALPKSLEEMEPQFTHIEAHQIPSWQQNGATFKLIAGEFMEHRSPVPVHSPLYLLEIKANETTSLSLGNDLFGETGLYILEGAIREGENTYGPRQILVTRDAQLCKFEMEANTIVYLFGGEAFPEERFLYWNFVSSSKERLEQAKMDWKEQRFPRVPGETEAVPLPQEKFK